MKNAKTSYSDNVTSNDVNNEEFSHNYGKFFTLKKAEDVEIDRLL